MTKNIIGQDFVELASGRKLAMTMTGGSLVTGTNKDGPIISHYEEGDILLTDPKGEIIVGPISAEGAEVLALRILNGDSRALTEPQGILILATMLLATMTLNDIEPDEDDDLPGAEALDEHKPETLN